MLISVRNSFDAPTWEAADLVVHFDIFRASTTLLALLSQKPARILSANDRATVERFRRQGYTLVSEVFAGGIDNSPSQVLSGSFQGAKVIHKSTNLTNSIFLGSGSATRTVIGGFVNATCLVSFIRSGGFARVELVAAAHFGRREIAVEDWACAQMVLQMLEGHPVDLPALLRPVRAYLTEKRRRRSYPDHYWRDTELALALDTLPYLAEVRPLESGLLVEVQALSLAGLND